MYGLLQSVTKIVYPSPKIDIPHEVMNVIKTYSPMKIESQGIIYNHYPVCLYDAIPQSKHSKIDNWFIQSLSLSKYRKSRNAFFFIGLI